MRWRRCASRSSRRNDIFDASAELQITITTDEAAATLTIADAGIGMTRAELIENLGTIAHSGSKAFAAALKNAGKQGDATLIGQFGVGFYSAFMVADKVEVHTHSWKNDGEHLVWTSDGTSSYTIDEAADQARGCKIVLHLKEDAADFAKEHTVKQIIEKHSNFVSFPLTAQWRARQHGGGPLAEIEGRHHRRAVQRVLQVHRPRFR
jgi:TNF receptor-associated protein 1